MTEKPPILQLDAIYKKFGKDPAKGLKNISLTIAAGETMALVGHSGAGKTTLARLIMCLNTPDSGRIFLNGSELTALSGAKLRRQRAKFQMVFQDPLAAFNPRRTIAQILQVPLALYADAGSGKVQQQQIADCLQRVGLTPAMADMLPSQLSGGQRQRVAIARALVSKPDLIVLDEPVSALDISVRAKILNLLRDLQQQSGLAYLFISHDLAIIRAFCDRMVVLDHGEIVECGVPQQILQQPQSAVTRQLIAAVPQLALDHNSW